MYIFELFFAKLTRMIISGTVQDKIFVTQGNAVRGYTKKGKLFLNLETQLLEPIKNM